MNNPPFAKIFFEKRFFYYILDSNNLQQILTYFSTNILSEAISYGVGIIGQDEIDEINILNATKKGLTQVVGGQKVKPDIIIVDALNNIDTLGIPYTPIIKGDALAYSISCASIIAKVTRDRIMRQMDEIYPEYGFAGHKGYGTAKHIAAIKEYGLCKIHRRSFTKNFVK